ncbi:MAG: Hpt domain-containing protein [Rickettsiales bacterium]|nr:Hpt domain-containing protein [Rickettsiales bacterium]
MADFNYTKKPIDVEFLRSVIENDAEFERELFKIFIENGNRNIEKLEDSFDPSRYNFWYMAAHAFKGSAASIGAFDLAKILEDAQKSAEDNAEMKIKIVENVKKEFKSVCDFIASYLAR